MNSSIESAAPEQEHPATALLALASILVVLAGLTTSSTGVVEVMSAVDLSNQRIMDAVMAGGM